MPADILLYAIIATGLVLWLRNILGSESEGDRKRPNPFAGKKDESAGNVHELPIINNRMQVGGNDGGLVLPYGAFVDNKTAENALLDLMEEYKDFDLEGFVNGARDAFAIIVEAFAEGDRDTLKNLLSDNVYASFDAAITEREAQGIKVSTKVHDVSKAVIMEVVKSVGSRVSITIEFTANETCVVKNAEGDVISGNPDEVTTMKDIWVFEKDMVSDDPRWLVVETRDGEVEDHKTPIPEA